MMRPSSMMLGVVGVASTLLLAPARSSGVTLQTPQQELPSQQTAKQRAANQPVNQKDSVSIQNVLSRRVSIRLDDVSLDRAIRMTAAAANIRVLFKTEDAEQYPKRIRLSLTGVSLDSAFRRVLAGTNLSLVASTPTTFVVRERLGGAGEPSSSSASAQDSVVGAIAGKILDSVTQKGVGGAAVTIVSLNRSVKSHTDGTFQIENLPAGKYTLAVKLLGYQAKQIQVAVPGKQTSRVNILLAQSSTTLTEVVTTATGLQRSFEIGSDITRINVDEVRKYSDITSVADLLATRVPGMITQSGGGDAGAGSRIRVRGIHSISLSNDPILIIDGVRVETIGQTSMAGDLDEDNATLSSRLNDIDPASIETIEVFKGPSAATLYGPDAANGVIVITRKRGLAGETRWTIDANTRFSSIPRPFAERRVVWGKHPESNEPYPCTSQDVLFGMCIGQDSVTSWSALNDSRFTTIGRGHNHDVGLSMQTGSNTMQTALNIRMSDKLGATKLSQAGVERLQRLKGAVPSWARRPNAQRQLNGSANVTFQSIPRFDVAIRASMAHLDLRNNGNGISSAQNNNDSLAFLPEQQFLKRREELTDQYEASLAVSTRQWSWFNWSGTFGMRHGKSQRDDWQRAEDCLAEDCSNAVGERMKNSQTTANYSVNSWAGVTTQLSSWGTLRSTAGLNHYRSTSEMFSMTGFKIPFGVTNPTEAPVVSALNMYSQSANAGAYLEERLSVGARLFLNGAIRRDVGSALGQNAKTPTFPKFDLSWVALDHSVDLPGIGTLNTLRLRAAHGQSGHQPTLSQLNATLGRGTVWHDGASHPVYLYESLGNSYINPERTSEVELGADANFTGLIEAIGITYFRHITKDALISRPISIETGLPNTGRTENLGKLQNSGVEATALLRLLDGRFATWTLNVAYSQTRNKVLSLGRFSDVLSTGTLITQRVVVGYPVFGMWVKPIYGYEDRDHNGALDDDEIVRGDSAVYVGWGQPKYTMNYHSSVGLWRGNVNISSTFSQTAGMTKVANLVMSGGSVGDLEGQIRDRIALRMNVQTVSSLVWNSANVTVQVPSRFIRHIRGRSGTISLSGTNLYQWTNFRGSDPNVGPVGVDSDDLDRGITPNTRNYTLRLSITY